MKNYSSTVYQIVIVAGLLAITASCPGQSNSPEHDSSRWEPAIQRFEKQDAKQAPPKQANLFVGSSSIRLWKLAKSFPDFAVINRGFGGSQYADAVNFADRIVIKHEPRVVVVFSGSNDINAGKKPEQVHKDFQALVAKIKQGLPEAKLVCIGVKPSPRRWSHAKDVLALNRLIQSDCEKDDRIEYVDVWGKMLGDDGRPRAELFIKDNLHMNEKGYKIWQELVRPHLEKPSAVGAK